MLKTPVPIINPSYSALLPKEKAVKNTLAKLIVVSEINGVELDALVASILEKGIEENGFYEWRRLWHPAFAHR